MAKRRPVVRPSGHQHRKKARARHTTQRTVLGLLAFANDGLWPVPPPRLWLTVEDSSALRALRTYVDECFERFQPARGVGVLKSDVREVGASADFLYQGIREPNEVWLLVSRIGGICHQLLGHLQEDGRWRNVYRCATCRRWFLARSDRKDPETAYCGRKCWPSKQSVRSEAPTRRVTRRATRDPRRN